MKKLLLIFSLFLLFAAGNATQWGTANVTIDSTGTWQRNSWVVVNVKLTNPSGADIRIQGVELDMDFVTADYRVIPGSFNSDYFTTGYGPIGYQDIGINNTTGKVTYWKQYDPGYGVTLSAGSTITAYSLRFQVTNNLGRTSAAFSFSAYLANDIADNVGHSIKGSFTNNSFTINADTTAPSVEIVPASGASFLSGSTPQVKLRISAADTSDDYDQIYYSLNGAATLNNTASKTGFDVSIANEGNNTVRFYGTDLNGNQSATQTATYLVDTINPTMSVFVVQGKITSVVPNRVKAGDVVTISFSVGETLLADPTVSVGGYPATKFSTVGLDYVYTLTVPAGSGTSLKNVNIAITDVNGNTSSAASSTDAQRVVFDYASPTYLPLNIGPTPVVSGNPVYITFNASERLNTANVTMNMLGRTDYQFVTEYLDGGTGKWTYAYQTAGNLTGAETTAIFVVHGEDLVGNRSDSNMGWGSIKASGHDTLNNYGETTGSMDFKYEE